MFAANTEGTIYGGVIEAFELNGTGHGNLPLQEVGRTVGTANGFATAKVGRNSSNVAKITFQTDINKHLDWDSSTSRRVEIQPSFNKRSYLKQGVRYKIGLAMTRPQNDNWNSNNIIVFQVHEDGAGSPPVALSILPGGSIYATRRPVQNEVVVAQWQASGVSVVDYYIIELTLAQKAAHGSPYLRVQRASGTGALQEVAKSTEFNNYTTSASALFYTKFGFYAWYGSNQLSATPLFYDHYGVYIANMDVYTALTDDVLLAHMRSAR